MAKERNLIMVGKFVKAEESTIQLEMQGDYFYGAGEFYMIPQFMPISAATERLKVHMSREFFLKGILEFKIDEGTPSAFTGQYIVIHKDLFDNLLPPKIDNGRLVKQRDELYRLLDDIDTVDDICRADDRLFRKKARVLNQRRKDVMSDEDLVPSDDSSQTHHTVESLQSI